MEFGFFPSPAVDNFDNLLRLVEVAESTGLDLVSIQDHPYQRRFLDTWTLLSVIGARTTRLKVAPNVANLPLRPPVMLAKSVASLDRITGGRVELGLGAGAFWDAVVAAGGPRRTPGEAVRAVSEAITLMREFWQGGTVDFTGEFYSATGLHAGPTPAHPIPIWLGARGPRMLRLTGAVADAWIPSLGNISPEDAAAMNPLIDEGAARAGRDPADITRMYNISGTFDKGAGDEKSLGGSTRDWAERLLEFRFGLGMTTFILATDDPDELARFATEVVPLTRELEAVELDDSSGS